MRKTIAFIIVLAILFMITSCQQRDIGYNDYAIYLISPGDSRSCFKCEEYEIIGDSVAYITVYGYEGFVIVPEGWALAITRHCDD